MPQMPPNPGMPSQQITQADLESAKTVECIKCKCKVFSQGITLKKTSPLSTIGEHTLSIPVIYCVMCGTTLEDGM